MEAQKLLEEVGLTDTEARIYLAGRSVDAITVQEIGTATGVKRPTIYHALSTLTEKGLVTETERNGKSAYRMEAPARLLGWIEQQKNELTQKEDAVQAVMTELASQPQGINETTVTQYTNQKDVQAVFDLAFYARSKECVVVMPSKNYFDELGFEERCRDAEHRGMHVRTIIKKDISVALLAYDETVVLITSDLRTATTISSSTLTDIIVQLA